MAQHDAQHGPTSRRHFIKAAGRLAVTAATAAATGPAIAQAASGDPAPARTLPFLIGRTADTLLARGNRRRVVICGGGWGGVTAAKYLRQYAPELEVVLLERNPVFFSCPMSNKWLVDQVDGQFLTHDYLAVSEKYDYRFIQTEILEIERDRKTVLTAAGSLPCPLYVVPGTLSAADLDRLA